jgi:NitT/TauT family transport system substrate-binding protein
MEVAMRKFSIKKAGAVCLAVLTAVAAMTGCGAGGPDKAKEGKTKIVLNEVAHSIFYAPMYVAIEEGYFGEVGIELSLVTGFGADKTMTAVLTGEADIGFMGSESTIYTYVGGTEDYVVNFAQLTQRAGNFLVSREPMEDFSWEMIKGKEVLGGRAGGMPSHDVTWEHIRGIYEWTSRKALDLKGFKYEEKVVSVS